MKVNDDVAWDDWIDRLGIFKCRRKKNFMWKMIDDVIMGNCFLFWMFEVHYYFFEMLILSV